MADYDIRADRVHNIDRLGFAHFPRSRHKAKCIQIVSELLFYAWLARKPSRLVCKRADRTQIDDVAGELGGEKFVNVRADLHIAAATRRAKVRHAGDLACKANAARTLNTARHNRFDEWPNVFVLDGALAVELILQSATIRAEIHRLILQVAFAALIANWTIKRMIDEKKFHDAFARFFADRRICFHAHSIEHWHCARCDRLKRFLDLNKTHSTIAGDREAIVIAKARYVDANKSASLKSTSKCKFLL